MDVLPTIGFALAIGVIVVVSTMRGKRIPRDAESRDRGGFAWNSADSSSGSAGGDCGGGGYGDGGGACGDGGAGCGDGGGGGD